MSTDKHADLVRFDHYFVRLQQTIRERWDYPALCNFQGDSMTYGQMATEIARMHVLLEEA